MIKYPLDPKTAIFVSSGDEVAQADILAKTPKAVAKSKDITGGLPRVSELFEARRPKNTAIVAEIDGVVRFDKPLRSKERIIIQAEDGTTAEYLIEKSRQIQVRDGEFCPCWRETNRRTYLKPRYLKNSWRKGASLLFD